MISINSTEEERVKELSTRTLKVVPWDMEKAFIMTDANESVSKALNRYAKENGIVGTTVKIEGFDKPIKITKKTINESISSMCNQQSDLYNLGKLLTQIEKIIENAVVLEVEPYRYKKPKASLMIANHQYISAFCDMEFLYPVKITAEERVDEQENNVYITITIGTIQLDAIEKEGVSIPRLHLYKDKPTTDSGRTPSFDITIPQLLSFFNSKQGILIKNFPDAMLSETQLEIKQKILLSDMKKELIASGEVMSLSMFTKELEDAFNKISKAYAIQNDEEFSLTDKENVVYKAIKEDLLKKQEEKPFIYELATKLSLEDITYFKEIAKSNMITSDYVITTEAFEYEENLDYFYASVKDSINAYKHNDVYELKNSLEECVVDFQTFLSEEYKTTNIELN